MRVQHASVVALVGALVLAFGYQVGAEADSIYSWDASSGLYPDQVSTNCTLKATGGSQVLSGGLLTFQNDSGPPYPYDFYEVTSPALGPGVPFSIDATMRFVSEQPRPDDRDAAGIDIYLNTSTYGAKSQTLYVGPDRLFLCGGNVMTRGDTAYATTTDAFHHYHVDVGPDGMVSASFDGVPEVAADFVPMNTWPQEAGVSGVTFAMIPT